MLLIEVRLQLGTKRLRGMFWPPEYRRIATGVVDPVLFAAPRWNAHQEPGPGLDGPAGAGLADIGFERGYVVDMERHFADIELRLLKQVRRHVGEQLFIDRGNQQLAVVARLHVVRGMGLKTRIPAVRPCHAGRRMGSHRGRSRVDRGACGGSRSDMLCPHARRDEPSRALA